MSTSPKLTWTAGHPVAFTAKGLGLVEHEDSTRFEPEAVHAGDRGRYLKPHPTLDEWHLISVNVNGRELLCPCHECQFEAL